MAETLPYIGFQEFQRLRDGHAFYDRNVNKKVGRSFWRGSPDLIQLWWSKRRLWLGLAFFSRFAGEMTAYNVLALSPESYECRLSYGRDEYTKCCWVCCMRHARRRVSRSAV